MVDTVCWGVKNQHTAVFDEKIVCKLQESLEIDIESAFLETFKDSLDKIEVCEDYQSTYTHHQVIVLQNSGWLSK